MSKKTKGTKYKSEEDVYEDLLRLIPIWKNKFYANSSKRSYLKSVKKDFRSLRICKIIAEDPTLFNLAEEIKYMPMELLPEEFLIEMVYDTPKLLCSKDEKEPREVAIPEERQTLPVLVAFELGKRRYERNSARMWGKDGEKIPYPERVWKYRNTITDIAERIEEKIGIKKLQCVASIKDTHARQAFLNELVSSIQRETAITLLQPDEHYNPKYTSFNLDSNKKILILVSGYADSGKTTFSSYLASKIRGAICFDSDMLLERGLLETNLSQLIRPKNKVVIFSDLDANDFFSQNEIKEAMGEADILKVYMKPISTKRMLQHSKYRQRSRYRFIYCKF